mmetsp:Transcript_23936/g.52384  ORF Transcript_23936/g.52384 Transcript_23936/m.52384 type:complete len:103 (-) Transcript_23936:816-1124(-)
MHEPWRQWICTTTNYAASPKKPTDQQDESQPSATNSDFHYANAQTRTMALMIPMVANGQLAAQENPGTGLSAQHPAAACTQVPHHLWPIPNPAVNHTPCGRL